MLVFPESRLTYLAVPKTGTTAIEMALRPRAEIIFAKARKHITARRYTSKVAPFLSSTFGIETETVAIMRDPVEQIRSWYKYRRREELIGQPRSTAGMSFDDFVQAVISDDPPEFAKIGSQFRFLTDKTGAVIVDHLFDYSALPAFLTFMSNRLAGPVELKEINVSPRSDAPLSDAVRPELKAKRSEEFALYERLSQTGYLHFA